MASDAFTELDGLLKSSDPAKSIDFLAERFLQDQDFNLLFEARLMQKRSALGLPLIQTVDSSTFPPELRSTYEEGMVEAAREVGGLYLAGGNIPRAWPYFRAISENGPVISAIEDAPKPEDLDAVIAIALQEGIHPVRGLELTLEQHGMCRALTSFGMYGVQKDREKCISLLTQHLHREIVERMTKVIVSGEGKDPETRDIRVLIDGRDWLFGEYDYYVDTSHLVSLLPYCLEVTDTVTLQLFHELCEYGKKLGTNFQVKGQPPFEHPYIDYGEYVQAALGNDIDARIAHFRKIAEEADPDYVGNDAIHFLIKLLARFERYEEAIEVSLSQLDGEGGSDCPSALQLCRMAGDYEQLKSLAKMRGDALSYAAAGIEGRVS